MGTLTYKDYLGTVEYDSQEDCLVGKVLGLPNKVAITYEGQSLSEIRKDFEGAVDDYLDYCNKKGITPQKSYSGSFNIRISSDLHYKIAMIAQQKGETINAFVKQCLENAVKVI